ncbi:MAG: class I SAM-dependent methyltransferase [Magnetococcales bacterium]|nr:class I SAM-dependent methyltransferase [Magnetococcales bacterium]
MSTPIFSCRICNSNQLAPVFSLGEMAMTGIFPKYPDQPVSRGELALVKCDQTSNPDGCGLLQLAHNFDLTEMYGIHYGYRSGLNASMVNHLRAIVADITKRITLSSEDLVVDIGSNDGTLLSFYPEPVPVRVGIDPTGIKFSSYYPKDVQLIPDFFRSESFRERFGNRKAKVVTSVAMFYDLPDPMGFMSEVKSCLSEDGLWLIEFGYMPRMLETLAYDAVCHEHLEYYGFSQIHWMCDRVGFRITDISFNDTNGGSIRLILSPSPLAVESEKVRQVLADENRAGLATMDPYFYFAQRIIQHREEMRAFVSKIKREGKRVLGYGASTKGNVVLQYCNFTKEDIPSIADVNEDKYGRVTPGSLIPIISEKEAKALNPDYLLVLPWHFEKFIIQREVEFIKNGGRLLFPLPNIRIYPS